MGEDDQRREIAVWRASWERWGWETRVLSAADYQRTTDGREAAAAIAARGFPSANPPGYDLACFLRWVALWMAGGGLMTDYDTVNLGYTPAEHAERIAGRELVEFCAYRTPAMLYVSREKCEELVQLFANYQLDELDVHNGKPHVSDMTILKRSDFGYTLTPWQATCQELDARRPGCKVAHVSHHAMRVLGISGPRWETMERVARGEPG